jgi:hypothetical protein
MAYVAYEIRMTKETPTGTRHLVRCNRLGKYAIATWDVMKKWEKIVGKYVPVTYRR